MRKSIRRVRSQNVPVDLSPENMEVVGGGSAVDNLPIRHLDLLPVLWVHLRNHVRILIGHLEEALETGAGVLWAHSWKEVRRVLKK